MTEINKNAGYEAAQERREILVRQLEKARKSFCGIGTYDLKLMLNELVLSGNHLAEMYRVALEIEDHNILAKKYSGDLRKKHYESRDELIEQLIHLCKNNGIVYGRHSHKEQFTSHIVYFKLPMCDQISFHCNLQNWVEVPPFKESWDGKSCSNL